MSAEICAGLNHSMDWSSSRAILRSSKLRVGCVHSRELQLCHAAWSIWEEIARIHMKYVHWKQYQSHMAKVMAPENRKHWQTRPFQVEVHCSYCWRVERSFLQTTVYCKGWCPAGWLQRGWTKLIKKVYRQVRLIKEKPYTQWTLPLLGDVPWLDKMEAEDNTLKCLEVWKDKEHFVGCVNLLNS